MNARVQRLRRRSLDARPSVSVERAILLTDFYRENIGKCAHVILRAKAFHHLCANKTIFIGFAAISCFPAARVSSYS